MGREDAIIADQRQMVTASDKVGQEQRHYNTNFDHFACQIGLNEAHFEQRHHEHDKELHEHAQ